MGDYDLSNKKKIRKTNYIIKIKLLNVSTHVSQSVDHNAEQHNVQATVVRYTCSEMLRIAAGLSPVALYIEHRGPEARKVRSAAADGADTAMGNT